MLASKSRRISGQAADWDTGNKKVANGQVIFFVQEVFNFSIIVHQHGVFICDLIHPKL
jgi:hypothetical protein